MRRLHPCAAALATLVVVLASCSQESGWAAVQRGIEAAYPDVRHISTDSLAAWLESASTAQPVLLDVRGADEYATSHLRGAVRVDPEMNHLAALDTLPRDTPIVAYCSVGYRSSELASRLADHGFTQVVNLEGSIFRWANEGRTVYRDGRAVREVHPYDRFWGRLLDAELRTWAPGARSSS